MKGTNPYIFIMQGTQNDDYKYRAIKELAVNEKESGQISQIDSPGTPITSRMPISFGIVHSITFSYTPLLHALACGENKSLQALLESGANPNLHYQNDSNQWTPLHFAVTRGNSEAVTMLLGAGADTQRTDYFGDTPLALVTRKLSWATDAEKNLLRDTKNLLEEWAGKEKANTFNDLNKCKNTDPAKTFVGREGERGDKKGRFK